MSESTQANATIMEKTANVQCTESNSDIQKSFAPSLLATSFSCSMPFCYRLLEKLLTCVCVAKKKSCTESIALFGGQQN